jgi:hypothetical protein
MIQVGDNSDTSSFASRGGPSLRSHAGPKHVATRPLPQRIWDVPMYRICKVHHEPLHFGRSGRNRFDAPRGEFGVLYAAETSEGAFVEACIRERPAGNLFALPYFQERRLVEISFSARLRLVDLAGSGLSLLGADNRLATGSYRTAQRWSRSFWVHPDRPDGILYCSRFNPSLHCIALFDRSGAGCSVKDLGPLADRANRSFLGEMLDRYRLSL